MQTTRSKAQSADGGDAAAGSKHQLADTKEEKPAKKQKTLEETLENGNANKSAKTETAKSAETEEAEWPKSTPKKNNKHKTKTTPKKSKSETQTEEKQSEEKQPKESDQDDEQSEAKHKSAPESKDKSDSKPQPTSPSDTKSSSSILEKGIIYFFLRGRVNTEDPSSVSEIARTYFMLRPISANTSDVKPASHARLLAVPKKTFPKTGRERWISFVEKTDASFADLKENFLSGNEYETKTRGTQHTPPAKPEGEGVYAITTTGRENHLAYILTRPDDLGEVQKKLGLKEKGSWVITTRNPEYPPPGGPGRLPDAPEFPDEIKADFQKLRWAPTKPNHLDVAGAQILLVGESSGLEKATEPPKDQEKGEENPKEELEDLAEEDEKRMEALSQDDSEAIFKDLQASAKDFPDMQTEF